MREGVHQRRLGAWHTQAGSMVYSSTNGPTGHVSPPLPTHIVPSQPSPVNSGARDPPVACVRPEQDEALEGEAPPLRHDDLGRHKLEVKHLEGMVGRQGGRAKG